MRQVIVLLLLLYLAPAPHAHAHAQGIISAERVQEVARMLPTGNVALAPPCTDRQHWNAARGAFSETVSKADLLVGKPFPEWSDEAYLDYFKSGSRERGNTMINGRSAWLQPLVIAECVTWTGKYTATLATVLDELAAQKSWAMPAHDVDQGYITGKRYFVELLSADLADNLATALYLLGDRIPIATRQHVLAALEERVFKPMRISYASGKGQTWLKVQSNWNAVCLAGVTGAALAVLPDKEDRAFFVAAAEYYQQFYLHSFPEDGFEVEGIGYWNYGFSNYAVLREELWRATGGKIELFSDPKVQAVARFGVDFQMLPGVIAYFSDAHFGEEPSPALSSYVSRIFHVPHSENTSKATPNFAFGLMQAFPSNSVLQSAASGTSDTLRKFYPVSGVLVSRPNSPLGIAVTIKANGNGPHSHNDIGSFSIGLHHGQPAGEVGGPMFYTAQTFSKDRFLSKLLNSYGHPVPRIDGTLQKDALTVKAPVIAHSFSDELDTLSIDMTAAYAVPNLRRLVRIVTHQRRGVGTVRIEDEYRSRGTLHVEEALPTVGTWEKVDATTLRYSQADGRVLVTIQCPRAFQLLAETIDEYGRPFQRVAIVTDLQDGDRVAFQFVPERQSGSVR